MTHRRQHGFSLIEMSILIAVLSIFAVGVLTQLPTQKEYEDVRVLNNKMEHVRDALNIYLENNDSFPCPADGALQIGDTNFGASTDCTAAPSAGVVDITDVNGALTEDDVRIGVLPVKELGLKPEYMFDEWGNRLMYAVHKDLTDPTDYAAYSASSAGGIIIQDGTGTQLNNGLVPYLILSHGKDGRGAYTKAGISNDCSTESLDLDKGNCAWKTTTGVAALTFTNSSIRDDATAADFFYDKLSWEKTGVSDATVSNAFYNMITGGYYPTCALSDSGNLYCWGRECLATAGASCATYQATPLLETSVAEAWVTIESDSSNTCGLTVSGKLYCFGNVGEGRMGNGTSGPGQQILPLEVNATDDVGNTIGTWKYAGVDTEVGCGVATDGYAYCWGRDGKGRLGNGAKTPLDTDFTTVPNRIVDTGDTGAGNEWNDWIGLNSGAETTCGIRNSGGGTTSIAGTLWCWGDNTYNQVAPGATVQYNTPQQVGTYVDWESVVTDDDTTCGIRTGGALYCWGKNDEGQVGNNTYTPVTGPTKVTTLSDNWTRVSASASTTCGINSGRVYCWGSTTGSRGKLGIGINSTTRDEPTEITAEAHTNYEHIHVTTGHVCAMRESRELYCWGQNHTSLQRFGNNDTTDVFNQPVRAANSMLFN